MQRLGLNNRVVLITGASSGIGKATAMLFARKGAKVYGTSRFANSPTNCETLYSNEDGFLKMIQMDVCDKASIKTAVNYILNTNTKIDILMNNAGLGFAGAIEDTSIQEAKDQFDTNFFGTVSVTNEVLPNMRAHKNGLIICMGSIAGRLSIPYQGFYSASKFALEGYLESLRLEIKQFNLKACIVEPGDTKTGFTNSRKTTMKTNESSPYYNIFKKSLSVMEQDELAGISPERTAKKILRVAMLTNPPIRTTIGFKYMVILFLKRVLPDALLEFLVGLIYSK